jgi:DNA repair exonuclease SbcCD ATPase subunit
MHSLMSLLVEPAMYFAIGFLVAGLLSLPLFAITHRRAERLTKQQLNALLPMSVRELEAEKDLLRAEHAMSAQRLEGALHDVKARTTVQQIEIGRQSGAVTTLKTELGEKAKTIASLEARESALRQQLRAIEQEHALKSLNLDNARRTLMDKEAGLARLMADLGTRTVIAEQQNLEIARARANVEALKLETQDQHREVETLNARLDWQRQEIETASRQAADERGKVENLGRRVADLEIELIAQRNAAEALSKVTADRFTDQARLLAERGYEADRLQVALDAAHRAEASLRYEVAQVEERRQAENKAAAAEKATLDAQIAQLNLDRQQLQWELTALRRDAASSQAAERVESAMMRKRIIEMSDQMTQLRTVLEPLALPPGIADDTRPVLNGSHNGGAANRHGVKAEPPYATLDRISLRELHAREDAAPLHPVAS